MQPNSAVMVMVMLYCVLKGIKIKTRALAALALLCGSLPIVLLLLDTAINRWNHIKKI
jgi:hypothetical protein